MNGAATVRGMSANNSFGMRWELTAEGLAQRWFSAAYTLQLVPTAQYWSGVEQQAVARVKGKKPGNPKGTCCFQEVGFEKSCIFLTASQHIFSGDGNGHNRSFEDTRKCVGTELKAVRKDVPGQSAQKMRLKDAECNGSFVKSNNSGTG